MRPKLELEKEVIEFPRIEREILIGMIVSSLYLKSIQYIYKREYFQTEMSQKIASWCMDYFLEWGKAPEWEIKSIFEEKREKDLEETESDMISSFLQSLSSEHQRADEINIPRLIQKTENYFNSIYIHNLSQEADQYSQSDQVDQAKKTLSEYKPVEVPKADWINPFTDLLAIKSAFRSRSQPIFTFPGDIGILINSQLVRKGFIGIMGREKIGKTWFLNEFAFRAMKKGLNVAFFQLGDLSEEDQTLRFKIRLAGRSNQERYCGRILVPILDCMYNQFNTCTERDWSNEEIIEWVTEDRKEDIFYQHKNHQICTECHNKKDWKRFKGAIWYQEKNIKPLTWKDSYLLGKKFDRRYRLQFRQSCYPADSISIAGVENVLDRWRMVDGFSADVVILDYADILAPIDRRKEYRHQQNETWMRMRAMSMRQDCLVVTATQTGASSYEKKSIGLRQFSEDKRKYAHVTCMLALNQIPEEKRKGLMRISQLVVRGDEFDIDREVTILQSLSTGRPVVDSYFEK